MISVQTPGLIARAFIVFASLPQIIKMVKTKKTKDISLPMYIVLDIGCLLWIVYGVLIWQSAIIITNVIFLFMNSTILFLKLKYG